MLRALLLFPLLPFYVSGPTPKDVDLEPQPVDSFTNLCKEPWKHADAVAPYRGVVVEENGSGRCCSVGGDAFMCIMHPGHQHEAAIEQNVRFYDGRSKAPRVDLVYVAWPNPGMPAHSTPPPYAELELAPTEEGFTLIPLSKASCAKPSEPAKAVCKNAGRYVMRDGIPSRT